MQTRSGSTLRFLVGALVVDVLIDTRFSVNIFNILGLDSCLVLVILQECDLSLLIFSNLQQVLRNGNRLSISGQTETRKHDAGVNVHLPQEWMELLIQSESYPVDEY